jgi:hypothetical protein
VYHAPGESMKKSETAGTFTAEEQEKRRED